MSSSNKEELALASSSINLYKSMLDAAPTVKAFASLAKEIQNWVIREKISESNFTICRNLAAGLLYPNSNGMKLIERVKKADRAITQEQRKAPLRLVASGSLGRIIGNDLETSYIATTVACLTRFGDTNHATEALCSMILDQGGHEENVTYRYDVQRLPIKSVISKIVSSTWTNIVNAGHDLGDLPVELRCLHQHMLHERPFAAVVMSIERSKRNIIIRSRYFLADLTYWLIHHFLGRMVVIVGSQVQYSQAHATRDGAKPSERNLRYFVERDCTASPQSCQVGADLKVEVHEVFGDGSTKTCMKGDAGDGLPRTIARIPLYHIGTTFTPNDATVNTQLIGFTEADLSSARRSALSIMDYVSSLQVYPEIIADRFAMRIVNLEEEPESSKRGLLKQTIEAEHLLHRQAGSSVKGRAKNMKSGRFGASNGDKIKAETGTGAGSTSPVLDKMTQSCARFLDLQHSAELRLGCLCKRRAPRKGTHPQYLQPQNCRYCKWLQAVFLFLGHAICDAAGLDSISGQSQRSGQCFAVSTFVHEIFDQKCLRWDTWFEVVASFALGVDPEKVNSYAKKSLTNDDAGIACWAAVQHGALVVIAPWLDVCRQVSIAGSFAVRMLEGNIDGVSDEFAVIHCENADTQTVPQSSPNVRGLPFSYVGDSERAGDGIQNVHSSLKASLIPQRSPIELVTTVFGIDENAYRLMTTVMVHNSFIRIVDPSKIVAGMAAAYLAADCDHAKGIDETSSSPPRQVQRPLLPLDRDIYVYRFDQAVATWKMHNFKRDIPLVLLNQEDLSTKEHLYFAQVAESHLELNVLMSLACRSSMIRDVHRCCVACAAVQAATAVFHGDRRVISFDPQAAALKSIVRR